MIEDFTRTMRDAAPRSAAQRQMMLANRLPQPRHDRRLCSSPVARVQLRNPDQIPAQLISLAGRDLSCVGACERL